MQRPTAMALTYWATLSLIVWAAGRLRAWAGSPSAGLFVLGFLYLVLLWGPLFLVRFVEGRPLSTLGLTMPHFLRGLFWGGAAFFLANAFGTAEAWYRLVRLGEMLDSVAPRVPHWGLEIVAQLVWIGLPEEIGFRGYLLTRLQEAWGTPVALLLSSLLFGVSHFAMADPLRAITACLMGLIYGWAFLETGSVYPSALAHIAGNLFGGSIIRAVLAFGCLKGI